ncbi:MAG: transglutaminase domain-containing protein [Pseudomonadota bacterium]
MALRCAALLALAFATSTRAPSADAANGSAAEIAAGVENPIGGDSTAEDPIGEDPARAMAMPPALRARLQDEVLAGAPSQGRRFERLVRFMRASDGLAMRYGEHATQSVADAYATRTANCVTYTLLFLAMAREAGLEARPVRIRRILSLRQDADTLYLTSHVYAQVRVGVREYAVDFVTAPVIARDAPESIDERQLLAHYHNNLAMRDLVALDTASALRRMRLALRLDPTFAPHWSNLGVIHLRSGDADAAGRAYAQALARDPDEAGALFNAIGLARRLGDARRAEALQRRLDRVQARDPFHHFLRATAHMDAGRYREAVDGYRRAIRLLRDAPEFHTALAHALTMSGDARGASRAMARARALDRGHTLPR